MEQVNDAALLVGQLLRSALFLTAGLPKVLQATAVALRSVWAAWAFPILR
jgi:hypothetical protein